MSDDDKPDEGREPADSLEDDAMKKLLKRSLAAGVDDEVAPGKPSAEPASLLPAVQKKLRDRSKGKFYADGWSTTQSKVNYVLVAVVMLLVIAICYVTLGSVNVVP